MLGHTVVRAQELSRASVGAAIAVVDVAVVTLFTVLLDCVTAAEGGHGRDTAIGRVAGVRDTQAVRIAGWTQVDEMRTLLELHYDQLHLEKYLASGKTGNKRRSSQFKVFGSIAQAHRLKLCQRISQPDSIKQIFRCPSHEDKWEKLEEARLAIARIILGERDVEIECAQDADDLRAALVRLCEIIETIFKSL